MLTVTSLGFCAWDIPALLVLIGMIAAYVIHSRNHSKRNKDMEEELAKLGQA